MLAMPSNLLAHHLHVLEQAGIITRRRSEGDRRRTYLRLIPGALDPLAAPPARAALRVLFVCTANSARSHLAAALWRRASTVPAVSAGTHPGSGDRSRRDRRGQAPPAAAAPAAAPPHQRRPARRRPGHHRVRPGPRGTRRGRGGALVRPGPGAGRRPGQLRRGTGSASRSRRAPRTAPGSRLLTPAAWPRSCGGGLDCPDDRRVQARSRLGGESDRGVGEPGRREPVKVLSRGTAPRRCTRHTNRRRPGRPGSCGPRLPRRRSRSAPRVPGPGTSQPAPRACRPTG